MVNPTNTRGVVSRLQVRDIQSSGVPLVRSLKRDVQSYLVDVHCDRRDVMSRNSVVE